MEVNQADHHIECNNIHEFEGHHQRLFIHECNVYKYANIKPHEQTITIIVSNIKKKL